MIHPAFLVELGTEELPPKALPKLSKAFRDGVAAGLKDSGLAHGDITAYATPRRLALRVAGLEVEQPEQSIERRGPAVKAAFDADGKPTRAATGFAASCGVAVDALQREQTPKGEWLIWRGQQPGQRAADLLPTIISTALARLPIPKRMRWGASEVEFVRPVQWLILLHGAEIMPGEVLGLRADRISRGHRFHAAEPISIESPERYAAQLLDSGHVMADFEARRERVREQVIAAGAELGGEAVIDPGLLEEVTGLVEWPVPVTGHFEQHFLDLPDEVIISTIQDHQRYFPVRDASGKLLPAFITVSNIESKDPSQVRAGNERVVRPRLTDALFFWQQDRKQPLAERREGLRDVVFQQQLGSTWDKTERVAALAASIAEATGGDAALARRAGALSRADLLTQVVQEMPELQGLIGRYYAQLDGEPAELAEALAEVYQPRFAGDALPATGVGRCVALAEKLDTLAGIFAIGKLPTGDRDPYALRRAALGVIRILVESELSLDLDGLLNQALAAQPVTPADGIADKLCDFVGERRQVWYRDQGLRIDAIKAVAAMAPAAPIDFHRRLQAVSDFLGQPAAMSLAAANKRISNILRKAGDAPGLPQPDAFVDEAEKTLALALQEAEVAVEPMREAHDYAGMLNRLAELREPIDQFFDDVMVMAEDPTVRRNRLALLAAVQRLFRHTADFSLLQGAGDAA